MMHSNIFQINSVLNAFKNPKNPKCITVSTKMFSSTTVFDMSKNKTEIFLNTNQYVSMISEGSCDTDDWSNDAENSALHHRNKLHLKYI